MSKFKYIKSVLKVTQLADKVKLENDNFRFHVTPAELAALKDGRTVSVKLESKIGRPKIELYVVTIEGDALRELNGEGRTSRPSRHKRTSSDSPFYD